MKKINSNNSEDKKEKIIQSALRAGGFVFPQTVSEVEAFEKSFGTTDVTLPDHLKVPDFIKKGKTAKLAKVKSIGIQQDNFAMAARDGASKLSDDVLQKMKEDRKKADAQFLNPNPKRK